MTHLNALTESEQITLAKLEEQKVKTKDDIKASEEGIAKLREDLKDLLKNKIVDQVNKTTLKASKVLDQALKEIAVCVHLKSFEGALITVSDKCFIE